MNNPISGADNAPNIRDSRGKFWIGVLSFRESFPHCDQEPLDDQLKVFIDIELASSKS